MIYNQLPTIIKTIKVDVKEMMFYQYLPIKMAGCDYCKYEDRLHIFEPLISKIEEDFYNEFGEEEYENSYIYLTVKNLYVNPNKGMNREGYHSDGFMTNDINYIWTNNNPNIFNNSNFELTLDDQLSLNEMEEQAKRENELIAPINTILRLNQFCIHKVAPVTSSGIRCFVKVSFSKDRYNLIGNSINHCLTYHWDMKPRKEQRNIPQQ